MSLELLGSDEACSTLLLRADEGPDAHVIPNVSQKMVLLGEGLATVYKMANMAISIGKLLNLDCDNLATKIISYLAIWTLTRLSFAKRSSSLPALGSN